MYLNREFVLSIVLDSDEFEKIISQSYCGDDYLGECEDEYEDCSLAALGMTVQYRASRYKKKIKLIIDAATITNGAVSDADKLVRKLDKLVEKYFRAELSLGDFNVSGLTLSTAMDVGSRENVSAYLKVIKRIGRVKGFSPASVEWLDDECSFCLQGNSRAEEFLIYDLEQMVTDRLRNAGESRQQIDAVIHKYRGILRSEVRLTKQKAIRRYTNAYTAADQIIELSGKSEIIFLDTFTRVVPYGAFHKKDAAIEILRSKVAEDVVRRRMLRLLVLIPEKKSIYLAQREMTYRHPDELLIEFAKLNLSPVTISKRQDTKYLNNLYDYL